MPRLIFRLCLMLGLTALLAACASGGARVPVVKNPAPIVSGTMRPYQVQGRWYRPEADPDYVEEGMASWYGAQFNGRSTASGERFDMNALTAAHRTLPLPGLVEVTNLSNGRSAVVRINDRGPYSRDRIIDLSRGSAEAIGMIGQGVARVRVRYLGPAPMEGGGRLMRASNDASDRARPRTVDRDRPDDDGPSRFWVQAGSFSDATTARIAADGLGRRASVRRAEVAGRSYWRVMLGPWDDANAAETARQDAVARGVRDALLVSGG